MFECLKQDLLRHCNILYGKPSLINILLVVIKSMGFQAMAVYRLGRWSSMLFEGSVLTFIRYFFLAIHFCLSRLIVKMYGIDIDRRAVIGKGLYIAHLAGIEIGNCVMGELCSIHQHVKIGSTGNIENGQIPHIGSCVWIGPLAKITGNVMIGDNSTISAGAVVIGDVKANNLVMGDPARVISVLYDNRSLLHLS